MADSPNPDRDDCFHCPQGDKPCLVSYQPGRWLAQLPAQPTAAVQDRPTVLPTPKPAFRRLCAGCGRLLETIPGHLAGVLIDTEDMAVVFPQPRG